jgi:hypothetical protein
MNQEQENFTPEEQLRNETEILKLKLEVENGAIIHMPEDSTLPAEVENEWFNHVYNYERLCREAGYTTVYDFIGKPEFKDLAEIPTEEVSETLEQLLKYMYVRGVELNFEYECYPAATLYKFVTDELFNQKVCRYRGPGERGHSVFCYEEFYPNHERDIFQNTMDFLYQLFADKDWNPAFLKFTHEELITLNGTELSSEKYSDCILRFKEAYPTFLFTEPKIDKVNFDLETGKGIANGTIEMPSKIIPYVIHFTFSYIWSISGLELELVETRKIS